MERFMRANGGRASNMVKGYSNFRMVQVKEAFGRMVKLKDGLMSNIPIQVVPEKILTKSYLPLVVFSYF